MRFLAQSVKRRKVPNVLGRLVVVRWSLAGWAVEGIFQGLVQTMQPLSFLLSLHATQWLRIVLQNCDAQTLTKCRRHSSSRRARPRPPPSPHDNTPFINESKYVGFCCPAPARRVRYVLILLFCVYHTPPTHLFAVLLPPLLLVY